MNRIIATIILTAALLFPSAAHASEAQQLRQYRAEVRQLKTELRKATERADHWRLKHLATKETWSKKDTAFVARLAGKHLGWSKAKTDTFIGYLLDIVYEGAKESSGSTHAGRKKGGRYQGLVQFDRHSWKLNKHERKLLRTYDKAHRKNWRFSGIVSVYRIARSYDEGGYQALVNGWGGTLGK